MSDRARLFLNGGSQAVRLPAAFRFPEDVTEVAVRREGKRLILEPIDEWPESFLELLGSLADEEPLDRPKAFAMRDPFAGEDEP